MSRNIFVVALFSYFLGMASSAQSAGDGKTAIREARTEAEDRLRESLLTTRNQRQVEDAVREVSELERAGLEDLQAIQNYHGPGDKEAATQSAITFWLQEIRRTTQQFLSSQANSGPGGRPTDREEDAGNLTDEYREAERKIEELVRQASDDLKMAFAQLPRPDPIRVEEVTKRSARELYRRQALDAALADIEREAKQARKFAARGDPGRGVSWIVNHIQATLGNFSSNIEDIYTSVESKFARL